METKEFERIVEKVKRLEKEQTEDKAELKSIKKRIKDEFDCDTIKQGENLLDELDEKIKSNKERSNKLKNEIEQSADWDNI